MEYILVIFVPLIIFMYLYWIRFNLSKLELELQLLNWLDYKLDNFDWESDLEKLKTKITNVEKEKHLIDLEEKYASFGIWVFEQIRDIKFPWKIEIKGRYKEEFEEWMKKNYKRI